MQKIINYSVFHPLINKILGFRECAMLKNIADKTNTVIELSANGKTGTTNSIISLVKLGIKENSGVVFTIKGKNQIECCHLVMDIIENGWHKESNDLIPSHKAKENNDIKNDNDINEKKTELISVDDVINLHIDLNHLIHNNINNWDFDYYNIVNCAC